MIFQWLLVWTITICSIYGQQYYDATLCSTAAVYPGTRYTCNSSIPKLSCQTFLVYRACHGFQTISDISSLFNIPSGELLIPANNVTSSSEILEPGREVLIPVQCSCSGGFFSMNVSYKVPKNTTFMNIACEVFESLVKSITLGEENQISGDKYLIVGTEILVPLKCACAHTSFSSGIKYLITYPIISGDSMDALSQKFKIPVQEIWDFNHLGYKDDTVYPNTTILVPIRGEPSINYTVRDDPESPTPGFLPTSPVEKPGKNMKLKKLYIAGSVIGFSLVLATIVTCCLYLRTLRKFRAARIQSSTRRSTATSFSTPRSSLKSGPTNRTSTNSCLSPDLLAGIKYSLCNYTAEELKKATRNFSEDHKVSESVYKGCIDNGEVLIKEMKFGDTRQVIDVHSRINHVNIVCLQGVCENDFSLSSYLVFEFPANGSLRDCLSSSNPSKNSLRWHKRTQIAFEIATGLHYLHYCTVPPHTHMNINTKNIFLTQNWRAKLTVFAAVPSIIGNPKESMGSLGGWIAPEHLVYGSVLEKADIFAFGLVLLELISGKSDTDGSSLRDSITFLGTEGGGYFEQLRNFVDPSLKEDYPLAEALCLAVLAKACVEDDPRHRPSMDDIIKVLARMV